MNAALRRDARVELRLGTTVAELVELARWGRGAVQVAGVLPNGERAILIVALGTSVDRLASADLREVDPLTAAEQTARRQT